MISPRMRFLPPGLAPHPVCLARAPAGQGDCQTLADQMWRSLHGGSSAGRGSLSLKRGPMGQPLARLGDEPGPWLSFSHQGGTLWAVMSQGVRVGIDLAGPDEFGPEYPWQRMAGDGEMARARQATGAQDQAAALLWAAKEAAVKSRGAGFHLIDPRGVAVGRINRRGGGLFCTVDVAGPVGVWARRERDSWLAVALASWARA